MRARNLIITLALLITGTVAAFAGLPQTISYQGYVKDSTGTPVNNNTVTMKFALYSSTRQGSGAVWSETQSVNVSNGIYSVQLGAASLNQAITAPFDVPYWLGVNVNGAGELPLQPLSASGYAFRAGVADSVNTNATLSGNTLAQLDSRYINPTQPKATTQQIATLRWDQVGGTPRTFPVGTTPSALAFDGKYIWVANSGSNTVMKLEPATGTILATVSVGQAPVALAFDGAHIWVANSDSNSVSKINLDQAKITSTISVGTRPTALCFDGTNIWVLSVTSKELSKINAESEFKTTFNLALSSPNGLAFDGTNVWVGDYMQAWKVDTTTGATSFGAYFGANTPAGALMFDGTNMWITGTSGNVVKWIIASGLPQFTNFGTSSPIGFDGTNIWLVNSSSSITKVNAASMMTGSTVQVGTNPKAIVYDGSNIWVANSGSNNVTRLLANEVSSIQLAPLSVTQNNIDTGAVTSNTIATGAVTDAKISGPIASAKLDLSNVPANGLAVGTMQLVTSGGNVGIGTVSPATTLDVNGSARVSDALSANTYHVPGAGLNSATSVFVHKVDTSKASSNICGLNNAATVIDNSIINNRPDAILFVTMNYGLISSGAEKNGPVFAVSYDDTGFCGFGTDRWVVYSVNLGTTPPALKNGALFNVMAILP